MNEACNHIEQLDELDIRILRAMQENCRLTTKELAARIHLSTTPTYERLKRLEREGYIQKYIAVLDPERLNRGFVVYCNVSLKQINKEIADEFTKAIRAWEEVTECYNVSGEFDYLLKIYAPNMKRYQEFVINVLGTLDCLGHIQSIFVMDTIKLTYGVPVSQI